MFKKFLLIYLCAPFPAQAETSWTLADAIESAKKNSEAISQAETAESIANVENSIAKTTDDPRIEIVTIARTSQNYRTAAQNSRDQTSRSISYGAQIAYDIYDFGRSKTEKEVAKKKLTASQLKHEEAIDSITWQVARAYIATQNKQAIARLIKNQLQLTIDKFNILKARYQQGLRSKNDLISAELDISKNQLALHQAETELFLAKQNLVYIVTPNNSGNEAFINDLIVPEKVPHRQPDIWQSALKYLKNSNETYNEKKLTEEISILEDEKTALKASLSPKITASLGLSYSNWNNFDVKKIQPGAYGQVSFNWEIPWNGIYRLENESINLKRKILESKLITIKDERKNIEKKTSIIVQQATQQYKLLSNQTTLAKNQQKLIYDAYITGQASALELSAAESTLINSTIDLIKLDNTVMEAILSLAEFLNIRDLDFILIL